MSEKAVRTRTVEKSERCRKDIKHFIQYNRKAAGHGAWYTDLGDRCDKLYLSMDPGTKIVRLRDEIRFNLYINSAGTGKNVQNYDM